VNPFGKILTKWKPPESLASTSLDSTWVRMMNSSSHHEVKSSRRRTTHNSIEKSMLRIVWNPCGFYLIKFLEKGHKFNTGYYIAEILEPLSQSHSIEAAGNERKLLVHADNARPHAAKLSTQSFNGNRMKSAPHPPYSADLAPSDFYLFRYAKRCLAMPLIRACRSAYGNSRQSSRRYWKNDLASGLSRMDGPIKEIYHY
jgi:hypothetical protein